MNGAAPWSVKGIEPKTREVAKDLARRSGMTLGEWLSEMIADSTDDDGYAPMSHRAALREGPDRDSGYDRRLRGSRRMDDAYGRNASALDVVEALSARIEAAERRSALAIDGVDKAVGGLVRRIDALQDDNEARDRRVDHIGEELREGRSRLRQVETDLGPRNAEAIGKLEQAIGKLAGQVYEAETRGRDAGVILRERMDKFEREHSADRIVDSAAARVSARLEDAQARTAQSLAKLELSFADLDRRLIESGRARGGVDTGALERLAEELSDKVETARSELLRKIEGAVAGPRLDRFDRALTDLNKHVRDTEERSAEALDTMGRQVLRIAENLNGRVTDAESAQVESQQRALKAVEDMGKELSRTLSGDVARVADAIDQRLRRTDDQHAMALERLGGEISRISERLSERIGQGERRAAQGVEELAEKLTRASEKMESRYDRASGELSERMRLSEERTAALLAEARDNIDRQLSKRQASGIQSDWREPAFPSQGFSDDWPGAGGPIDPAFPSDTVFVDEPVLTAEDDAAFAQAEADVFAPARAAPVHAERSAAPATVFAPPAFSDPVEAGSELDAVSADEVSLAETPAPADVFDDVELAEEAPVTEAPVIEPLASTRTADEALDDIIDDEVVIEPMPAFAPAPALGESSMFQSGDQPDLDAYDGDTAFAPARTVGAPGRPLSTREALAAARASAVDAGPDADEPKRRGFGFGFGGKSRLAKRMERQGKNESTLRKALIATTTAVVVVGGGAFAALNYQRLVAEGSAIPTATTEGDLLAASAVSPTGPVIAPPAPEAEARGRVLFEQATGLIEAGDAEGVRVMSQAANLGYPQAQFAMARLYETGEAGVTADPAEARRWTERAARGGEARAMHNLALYLFEGTGGARDQAGSLAWFQAAAQRGVVDSQYNLGRLFERGGEGLTTDPARAYEWYLIASRAGDTEAQAGAERLETTLTASQRLQAESQAEAFRVETAPVQG